MVKDFDAKLKEFAHLLIDVGMNVQPGQTPRIEGFVEAAPLVRLCVEACYDRGARNVVADWGDDFVTRQQFLRADETVFSEYPSYMKAKVDWLLENQCPRLSIAGSNPELLKGVDPARMQARRRVAGAATKDYFDAMMANRFQWCVGSYPPPGPKRSSPICRRTRLWTPCGRPCSPCAASPGTARRWSAGRPTWRPPPAGRRS